MENKILILKAYRFIMEYENNNAILNSLLGQCPDSNLNDQCERFINQNNRRILYFKQMIELWSK